MTSRLALRNEQTLGLNPADLHLQKIRPLVSQSENMGCWLMNKNVAKRQILIACAGNSGALASGIKEELRKSGAAVWIRDRQDQAAIAR